MTRLLFLLALLAPFFSSAEASVTYNIQYGGIARQYLLHVPACAASTGAPLVIALHGNNKMAAGDGIETQSGFSVVADQQCFIATYPYAVGGVWDNSADVGFVQAVVADIESRHAITQRFLVGHSGGARLTGKISCVWSSAITGFAQVGYALRTIDTRDCASAPAKPAMVMHGTADKLNPHNGGGGSLSAMDSAKFWADKYGPSTSFASEVPMKLDNGQSTIGLLYNWAHPVRFYEMTGGGHPFPSSNPSPFRSQSGGPTVIEIGSETLDPGANVIWAFFRGL